MAVTRQGVMVTYRCVDGLCLVVAAVANNGTSGSTRQDVIEAALATMVSSLLYSGSIAGGVLYDRLWVNIHELCVFSNVNVVTCLLNIYA